MLHLLKKASAAAKPKTNTIQARLMSGGHGHGGPPPTGFEAKVRAVLPQDYQVRYDNNEQQGTKQSADRKMHSRKEKGRELLLLFPYQ